MLSYNQQSERQVVLELKKKICIAAFLAALVMLVSCGNDAADNHEKNDKARKRFVDNRLYRQGDFF